MPPASLHLALQGRCQSEAASEMPDQTCRRTVGWKQQPVGVYMLGTTDARSADVDDLECRWQMVHDNWILQMWSPSEIPADE